MNSNHVPSAPNSSSAAYVMMACPVLESHHDIAALNSNSLVKK